MPIHIACPGCHTRFKVSEKHAGKEGACPKCKGVIRIPELNEQVVVHAPEHSELGASDSKGRLVLKPIRRQDSKFQPILFASVLVAVGIVFGVAWFFRGKESLEIVLALGAALLGPPLAWAGYSFLRDPELEPYAGRSLWLRSAICGLVYALLWAVFVFIKQRIWGDIPVGESLEYYQIIILAVPFLGVGAFTAYVSLDLEPGSGFFHYGLYLLVTVLLRMTLDLPLV